MYSVNCRCLLRSGKRVRMAKWICLLIVGQAALISCMPSQSQFRAYCKETAEIKVLNREKWKEFLDISLTSDGELKPWPFKKAYSSEEYEIFYPLEMGNSECRSKIEKNLKKPICKDGVFYFETSKIVVSRNVIDAKGYDTRINQKIIAIVRDDFYMQQKIVPQKYSCFSAFTKEYLTRFRKETLGE